jgi:hypothetical protein
MKIERHADGRRRLLTAHGQRACKQQEDASHQRRNIFCGFMEDWTGVQRECSAIINPIYLTDGWSAS